MPTYVIVGGVAGGATAAARLRRLDEKANIIVLERGPYVSFANCGLPYHIGGVITNRDALLVSTPEKLKGEFNIDVRTGQEVLRIDREAQEVEVRDLKEHRTYRLAYDKLVLSPGARPLVPPIPGATLPGVYTLRSIPDMDQIKAPLDRGEVHEAVVVGGGFIGLEMAENLARRGVAVTVVEMLDQVMAPIDFEMAAMVHRELREHNVRLGLGDGLQQIRQNEADKLEVILASGRSVPADMVILSLGVRPENELAKGAGLELGARGHIVVNDCLQTSDENIYAVGDAVQVKSRITGAVSAVPLAGPANRQARLAADHMVGRGVCYPGTQGTAIVKVFDITAAAVGANSRTLQQQGAPFLASVTHSQDHVTYYPGAKPQVIKLLYTPDGKLLGAQVVGYAAVDRTIDVLAVAVQQGMSVFDLEHLELAYAPPYGAAKDPVNIAGYVAANRLRGDTELIEWRDVVKLAGSPDHGILDVRTDAEWDAGHIPGAVHIQNTQLRKRLGELDPHKEWVVYCAVGRRAYVMERMLRANGFHVKNLAGGYTTYRLATEKQSNLDAPPRPTGETPQAPARPPAESSPAPNTARFARDESTGQVVAPTAIRVENKLDARGLQCPGPIMAVFKKMQEMNEGDVVQVLASDPGFRRDVSAWAERTGNTLLEVSQTNGTIQARLQKGSPLPQVALANQGPLANAKTIVVFSADLDRALASFVIANGAAAMGQKVTMFFTFWGLNILRARQAPPVNKNIIERMFGWMLPKGPDALKLSKLNLGGLGTRMMKGVMKSKNIDALPEMMRAAREAGVRLIACQMSMDMMGIKAEELVDGVEIGGVATYISETDKANASLFI